MITKTQEVHYCDYCNKHLFRKKAMQKHENICKFNPVNKPKCYWCKHFDVANHSIDYDDPIITIFECKAKCCIRLVSIIAEKQGRFKDEEDKMTMPHIDSECEHYTPKPNF